MSDSRIIDPLIMNVDRTLMADGRYLIYYSFEKAAGTEAPPDPRSDETETADDSRSVE